MITNGEKFKEVFGFKPNMNLCVAPNKICKNTVSRALSSGIDDPCTICAFNNWFDREYKACFRLSEEWEDE